MRIAILGKYPPIQGGVSAQVYWTAHELAQRGHEVHVFTNAPEVEPGYRQVFWGDDEQKTEGIYGSGFLRVHWTTPLAPHSYIPWAEPFASKLIGLSLNAVSDGAWDLIIGWYFEPYGVAAAVVGRLLGVPVILRHAGSDIGRLSLHPQLANTYRWMLADAKIIITAGRDSKSVEILRSLGAESTQLRTLRRRSIPAPFYTDVAPLRIGEIRPAADQRIRDLPLASELTNKIAGLLDKEIDESAPTLCTYGKIGDAKGSYALLDALERLAQRDVRFNYLAIAASSARGLRRFYEAVLARQSLAAQTWVLPPVAPWRIPALLRAADIVPFLEHRFPIAFHGPVVPREVLSAGRCLICSEEVADKQPFRDSLVDGKNYFCVQDPSDVTRLTSVLDHVLGDLNAVRVVSRHGQYLAEFWQEETQTLPDMADLIEAEGLRLREANPSTSGSEDV